jgi:lysozyme
MSTTRRKFAHAAWISVGFLIGGAVAPRAHGQTLNGIDVSNYQGTVNWTDVKNAGYSFAFAKATEGTDFEDAYFPANWSGMKSAGLIRGAYHFGHPSVSATSQAQYFVNYINAHGGFKDGTSLQLMLDLEDTDGESPSTVWTWVQNFIAEIKTLTGRPGIIYVGYYFWVDDVGNPTNNLDCPLFVASYTASPSVPSAWPYWTFWQYTDAGSVPGVSGDCDKDYFAGTLANLKNLCIPE